MLSCCKAKWSYKNQHFRGPIVTQGKIETFIKPKIKIPDLFFSIRETLKDFFPGKPCFLFLNSIRKKVDLFFSVHRLLLPFNGHHINGLLRSQVSRSHPTFSKKLFFQIDTSTKKRDIPPPNLT
jgi:hypothetical protein